MKSTSFENESEDTVNQRRLDAEWASLNALREGIGISQRGIGDTTYARALSIGQQVAPRLFDPEFSVIAAGQESPLMREYRQRAEARSIIDKTSVSPVGLLESDIAEYEDLLAVDTVNDQLRRKLNRLYTVRMNFEERPYSEHSLIIRDVYTAERPHLPVPPAQGDRYIEFRLPFKRALRIRVLHPDRPEHITGADLIYEFCDQNDKLARIALIQYKIWDGQTLRFSQSRNLEAQLKKLQSVVCGSGLCRQHEEHTPPASYRLPHCAAFLRPTDRLQRPDATLMSSGLHIPVCVACTLALSESGGRILKRDPMRGRSVSQRLFEELFNRNMLGSRWILYPELEAFYREHGIFTATDTTLVHAQEFVD